MKYCLAIVLANIAIAFAGRLPLPESLQKQWHFVMKDDDVDLGRVVGGTQVADGGRPYQIGLFRSGSFSCGGSFISSKTVLTAAHCVDGSENNPGIFTIWYGSLVRGAGTQLQVSRIVKHPSYSSSTINNDFALLILANDFTPGTNAAVSTLVGAADDPAADTVLRVSGWGRVVGGGALATNLLYADLGCIDRTECNRRWSSANAVTTAMICAHHPSGSACNGDSGGPLTRPDGQQVGVVSWGSSSCLHATLPNVYASVPSGRAWIDANTV
jgi:trypsin